MSLTNNNRHRQAREEKLQVVDVFGFGHCCIDYLSVLDPFPEKGKKGDIVESVVIGGGPVPTALLTFGKLGGTARFCGKIGADHDGQVVLEGLRSGGVDVSPMIIDQAATTARAFIWIDPHDASRTIALDLTRLSWPTADELDDDLLRACRIFLCDGRATEACLKGLRLARKLGVRTVLDVGAARPRFEEILELTDYAIVSRDLADTFSPGAGPDDLAKLLVRSGAGSAIVTIGRKGAVWFDGSTGGHVPGFEVDAVDTTGAGDVFHGAFIYGISRDWDIERSITFGNGAAALSCRRLSGQMGIPCLEEVEDLVASDQNYGQ